MKDLISIIVPVYNVEKYINRCIDSIINQTYESLEIILVDDGSTDSSGKICDEYANKDARIKVIHKKNKGQADARNRGIEIAKGDYIGFVDSDDWIHPDMFEKLYNALIEKNVKIACCSFIRCKKTIKNIDKKFDNSIIEYSQEQYIKKFFKINSQECIYYPWNKLYKREIIDENLYPISATAEDVVGTYKALLKCSKIVEINYPYYYYNYNPNSTTLGKFSKKDFDLIKVWDIVVDITQNYASKYLEYAILNRKRINFTLLFKMAENFNVKELKNNKTVDYLLEQLKKDEKYLLKAPIVLSRKIIIFMFCRNYYFVARFCKSMQK